MPHRLSSVCRRWFKMATSAPELWSLIYLNIKHIQEPKRAEERLNVLRERVRHRPVHLHLNYAAEDLDPNESFPHDN